jgi:hypothetical protein
VSSLQHQKPPVDVGQRKIIEVIKTQSENPILICCKVTKETKSSDKIVKQAKRHSENYRVGKCLGMIAETDGFFLLRKTITKENFNYVGSSRNQS